MKKLLLGASFLALAASSDAHFNGTYLGAKVGYTKSDVDYGTKRPKSSTEIDLKGFETSAFGGYWFQDGAWRYGLEAHAGHSFAKRSSTYADTVTLTIPGFGVVGPLPCELKTQSRRLWGFGLAGRFGQTIQDDVLIYGRLGLHVNRYESKFSLEIPGAAVSESKTDKFWSWAVAPGLGVEWAPSQGVTTRLEYVYEHSFTQHDVKFIGADISIKKPKTHTISLGVSFDI